MAIIIVGIIGGTGIDRDDNLIQSKKLVDLQETPFGWASDKQAISGTINGIQVYVISRHGKDHSVSPSHVNYRANIWTLVDQLKCTHILVTSACGSLKEEIKPGHIGVLDQYIDRTTSFRDRTFYRVCHVGQAKPVNETMQRFIVEACKELDIPCHEKLTTVTIEGPRFSTYAESKLHKSWGCETVNMTSVPEVQLASEVGAIYGCILLITDYDCWRSDTAPVTANEVVQRMVELGAKARNVIPRVIDKIAKYDWSSTIESLSNDIKCSMMNSNLCR